MTDRPVPDVTISRDLLMKAVNLRAVAWNALVWMPTERDPKNGWPYFFDKMHRLREAVNEPEHELIRVAYAASFGPGPSAKPDPRSTLNEQWQIVQPDPES